MSALLDASPREVEALVRAATGEWLRFGLPFQILQTSEVTNVVTVIDAAERTARSDRVWAVGFLTYEAGAAFGLRVRNSVVDLPLAWFALFDTAPARLGDVSEWCQGGARDVSEHIAGGARDVPEMLSPTLTADGFAEVFQRVKTYIAEGETYQVNYTMRLEGPFNGDPRSLFADLVRLQDGRYAAFIRAGGLAICSGSPELFFSRSGRQLTTRPMKGTARRGLTLADDRAQRDRLFASPKERAENVMIVDMMRNDLGRVAEIGTVHVPELLTLERYPTVWQMTSTVTASSDAPLSKVFAALHPSASVTGAPKVRTMEILRELEDAPRGIYTGAIGYIEPGGDAQFNVAIRTAVVDERRATISFGVGSGLLWDSNAAAEYDECLLKAAVLGRPAPRFDLLETLKWTQEDGFFLLDRHLSRLLESAEYFGIPCDVDAMCRALTEATAGGAEPLRIRLLVGQDGGMIVQQSPLARPVDPAKVALSAGPIDRRDVFLYHKTTNRRVYEQAQWPPVDGLDDVILWNEERELTETTIANLVIELDGERVTPPVQCGLLAGTFRGQLLDEESIRERVVTVSDLERATGLWMINSVQEWRAATLVR